jgi:hypothetical protein
MKKAFDENVSRTKPRLKLGGPPPGPAAPESPGAEEDWVYEVAAQVAGHSGAAKVEAPTAREVLAAAARASEAEEEELSTRSRVEATLREASAIPEPEVVQQEERVTVAVGARGAVANGIASTVVSGPVPATRGGAGVDSRSGGRAPSAAPPASRSSAPTIQGPSRASPPPPSAPPASRSASPAPMPSAAAPVAAAAERRPSTAVRTEIVAPAPVAAPPVARQAAPAAPPPVDDTAARRERLRERLRGVREHPRPEPLPTSVAAAGVLAVERIAQLQAELNQVKQHNAALQHDLDVARRAAERATEEARGRVEEARRLAAQMEDRAGLLSELERELQSVEGERDEALMAVQEARTQASAEREQRERLSTDLARKDAELVDSLSEEERLAGELERFRDDSLHLKKSVEVLSAERDTLARQVADLTAERAELLEARKALESVHRALTEAARR